jgi:hypothetical protein
LFSYRRTFALWRIYIFKNISNVVTVAHWQELNLCCFSYAKLIFLFLCTALLFVPRSIIMIEVNASSLMFWFNHTVLVFGLIVLCAIFFFLLIITLFHLSCRSQGILPYFVQWLKVIWLLVDLCLHELIWDINRHCFI